MKILQRYVLREVLGPIVLSMVALTLVLIVIIIFSKLKEVVAVISLPMLLELVVYVLPSLLTVAIPMAILTGVLLGIGRLTVDSEIKALRTHGVSLYPIFMPVVALGVLAAFLVLFNSLWFAPKMLTQSFTLLDELKVRIFNSLEAGRFEDRLSTDDREVILYFTDKDEKSSLLKNVYLWTEGGEPGPVSSQEKQKNKSANSGKPDASKDKSSRKKPDLDSDVTENMKIPFPQSDIGKLSTYTVEFWARCDTTGTAMTAVGFGNNTDDASWISCGVGTDGRLRFCHTAEGGSIEISPTSSSLMTNGAWHYVACVRAPEDIWQIYLDGTLLETKKETLGKTSLNMGLVGGLPQKTVGFPWSGSIGNVRVSNRARSNGEIAVVWEKGPNKGIGRDVATLWLGRPKSSEKKETKPASGVSARPEKEENLNKTLFLASSGSLQSDLKRRSITLTLKDGSMHFLGGKDDEMYSTVNFGKMEYELPLQGDDQYTSSGIDKTPQAMSYSELGRANKAYINNANAAAASKKGGGDELPQAGAGAFCGAFAAYFDLFGLFFVYIDWNSSGDLYSSFGEVGGYQHCFCNDIHLLPDDAFRNSSYGEGNRSGADHDLFPECFVDNSGSYDVTSNRSSLNVCLKIAAPVLSH